MTESDARHVTLTASPCRNGFEIVDHEIVIFNREFLDFLINLFRAVALECAEKIDSSRLAKEEAKAFGFILHGIRKFDVSLSSAHEEIKVAVLLKDRNNVFGTG